jgi:hypothetical protein
MNLRDITVVGSAPMILPILTLMIPIGRHTTHRLNMHIIHQCIIIHILGIMDMDIMGIVHPITTIIGVILRIEVIMEDIAGVRSCLPRVVPTKEGLY